MAGRKIKLDWARELTPETPAPPPAQRTPHDLPADFPAHLLDPDQLEAVAAWFDTWQAAMVDKIRAALNTIPADDTDNEGARADLASLTAHALVLAHLFRLHPAAEQSLPVLAAATGLRERRLYTIKQRIIRAVHGMLTLPPRGCPRLGRLADTYPQLDFRRRVGKRGVYLIPFRGHHTLAAQFETVLTLACHPGVTAALTLMADGTDAVRLTLTPKK